MGEKKKENKMAEIDKKALDLDFGDIAGGSKKTLQKTDEVKTKGSAKPRPKPKPEKKPPREAKDAYMLSIPEGRGYIFKDVRDCTGEQFLKWAKSVHPSVSRPAEDFDDEAVRIEAFKQIYKFHKRGLQWLRSNKLEKAKTFH